MRAQHVIGRRTLLCFLLLGCLFAWCGLTAMHGCMQMVVFMQQHQQLREGAVEQADLSAFIRNTVTIHSLITNRIDGLQPSQQLTLKVSLHPFQYR